jgi:hypothetical protein
MSAYFSIEQSMISSTLSVLAVSAEAYWQSRVDLMELYSDVPRLPPSLPRSSISLKEWVNR